MEHKIQFVARPGVRKIHFSKGLITNIDVPAGHDFEIVSFSVAILCDGTVASRSLNMTNYSAAAGGGYALLYIFSGGFVASDNKKYSGGMTTASGAYNSSTDWHEMIAPNGGSIHVTESGFVAGDSWSIDLLFRDIPVNLFL